MFHVPEKCRITDHPAMSSDATYGNNGAFKVRLGKGWAYCIASDGEGWEHVSVHIVDTFMQRTPTWAEMCQIKDLFWDAEDCVLQYHPPKSEYVNNHKHTLHLWKSTVYAIPLPESQLVGIKG